MAALKPLSDAQKLILTNAVNHPGHLIFPLPTDLRAHGASRQRVLTALLKQGLTAERPTTDDTLVWRRDPRGRRFTLTVTAAGRTAIGLPEINTEAATVAPIVTAETVSAAPPRGKLGSILSALAAEDGATLAALVTLTGWQPHTTRAALCRLRQRGYPIRLIGATGSKAYRLDTQEQA
jgi:hypothetical protein